MTLKIKDHFVGAYPDLRGLFALLPEPKRLQPSVQPLPSAVVRVIIGQMLSRGAADAIRKRVSELANRSGRRAWLLNPRSLVKCGLSHSKAEAIYEFGKNYHRDPASYEKWKELDTPSLYEAVTSERGMGIWTASILGIFHFGREDIFPETDGTIRRALDWLKCDPRFGRDVTLAPSLAAPYQSYLALYLWAAVDGGHLRPQRTTN